MDQTATKLSETITRLRRQLRKARSEGKRTRDLEMDIAWAEHERIMFLREAS